MKVLLEGIATHTIKGHQDEHNQLREKLANVLESFQEEGSPAESLHLAKLAVNALREYSFRSAKRLQARQAEQAAILRLILETLDDLHIASPDKLRQLMEVGEQLAVEQDLEKLNLGKLQLADCLSQIRKQAERQCAAASEDAAKKDCITQLPGRALAEAALAKACESDVQRCAVALVVGRIQLYNRRYGREVGDKVLRFFADFVERSFQKDGDEVYRGTGPSLLILRHGSIEKNTEEVRRIVEPRLQYDLDLSSRTILLCIDTHWSVFPMMVDPRLLMNKIDAFVSR